MTTTYRLPLYPSTQIRKSLSPSQLATLNQTISSSIRETIDLPLNKCNTEATRAFISSYAKDAALQTTQSLLWENRQTISKEDKAIRHLVLVLVETLCSSSPGLDNKTLIDIAVTYGSTYTSRVREVFRSSLTLSPTVLAVFGSEAVPAFTALLSPDHHSGLYGLRKTAHCFSSILHVSPPQLLRQFSSNKPLILALAKAYDGGLGSIARSYGGMRLTDDVCTREADDWERIWVETKVALIDSFHIIMASLLTDLTISSLEHTLDIIFALIDLPSSYNANIVSTPFLNRPILADYQQSYNLSRTLVSVLQQRATDDARVELLESTLEALDTSKAGRKDPGTLKLLLRSSGITHVPVHKSRGKAKGNVNPITELRSDVHLQVAQVLDILPGHAPLYIQALLQHPSYPFRGNAEKVIEALLEGTAPGPDEIDMSFIDDNASKNDVKPVYSLEKRSNIWDNEVMNLENVRVGKNKLDEGVVLKDRSFIEQMKADILRLAEEMSDSGGENKDDADPGLFEDDDPGINTIPILGDGEESSSESSSENEHGGTTKDNPEMILELAYIRDPKLFDRDAQTRRGKAREELKTATGWGHEQIEGWRIMLEKDPRKDRILEKHEASGNLNRTKGLEAGLPRPSSSGQGGDDGRGRGRGRGRGGRGGGGGGGRGRGGGGDPSARERAWKDKNKASRANHDRKRGHDKKMARGGQPV